MNTMHAEKLTPSKPFLSIFIASQFFVYTPGKLLIAVHMAVVYMVVQGQPLSHHSLRITIFRGSDTPIKVVYDAPLPSSYYLTFFLFGCCF